MKYLVTMELIGTSPLASPQEAVQWLEQMAMPQIETMMKLEAERKILAGGVLTGGRGSASIVEAASNEELDQLLMSLPLWGMMKVDVTPLVSFEARAAQTRQSLEHLKAALK